MKDIKLFVYQKALTPFFLTKKSLCEFRNTYPKIQKAILQSKPVNNLDVVLRIKSASVPKPVKKKVFFLFWTGSCLFDILHETIIIM